MKPISYGHQSIDSRDIKEVVRALKSDWLTQGPKIKEFENALCKYTCAEYAVAVSSGTAALHLSMLALGIGKNDETITSPITFSASANCALYVGAIPKFVDIDDATYHLDIEKLKDFLKKPSRRRRVRALVPVHFMGTVSDMVAIKNICERYGIKIVEDAAHALGAEYRAGRKWLKVGCSVHSDITILSFHPIKHITTGEGGALLTNNRRIYETALRLRHHGILRNGNWPRWRYDIPQVGFNYRITDFQCALGMSQMKKLDKIVDKRRRLVRQYNRALSDISEIQLPNERSNTRASYHLYVIRVPATKRDLLYNYLRKKGILTQINYIPVHLLSFYKKELGYRKGNFPVAERYYTECLSLPLYSGLSEKDQERVINEIRRFFGR